MVSDGMRILSEGAGQRCDKAIGNTRINLSRNTGKLRRGK
jgi:hypothetical protein